MYECICKSVSFFDFKENKECVKDIFGVFYLKEDQKKYGFLTENGIIADFTDPNPKYCKLEQTFYSLSRRTIIKKLGIEYKIEKYEHSLFQNSPLKLEPKDSDERALNSDDNLLKCFVKIVTDVQIILIVVVFLVIIIMAIFVIKYKRKINVSNSSDVDLKTLDKSNLSGKKYQKKDNEYSPNQSSEFYSSDCRKQSSTQDSDCLDQSITSIQYDKLFKMKNDLENTIM